MGEAAQEGRQARDDRVHPGAQRRTAAPGAPGDRPVLLDRTERRAARPGAAGRSRRAPRRHAGAAAPPGGAPGAGRARRPASGTGHRGRGQASARRLRDRGEPRGAVVPTAAAAARRKRRAWASGRAEGGVARGSPTRATWARCGSIWPRPARCRRRRRRWRAALSARRRTPRSRGSPSRRWSAARQRSSWAPGATRTSGPSSWWGSGGIAVEILKDVVAAPAPVSPARPRHARRPPHGPAPGGRAGGRRSTWMPSWTRWCASPGSPPTSGARLIDLEVNPLIVRRAGGGAVAVDGRGSLADIPKEESRSMTRIRIVLAVLALALAAAATASAQSAAHRAQRRSRRARPDHQPSLRGPARLRRASATSSSTSRPICKIVPAARHRLRVGRRLASRSVIKLRPGVKFHDGEPLNARGGEVQHRAPPHHAGLVPQVGDRRDQDGGGGQRPHRAPATSRSRWCRCSPR